MHLIHISTSGKLPTAHYELSVGNEIVGFTQIRHKASNGIDIPEDFANHIYYEIYEQHRGKGYGKNILALALNKAKEIGLKEIIFVVMNLILRPIRSSKAMVGSF